MATRRSAAATLHGAVTRLGAGAGWLLLFAVAAAVAWLVPGESGWRVYPAAWVVPVADLINQFVELVITDLKAVTRALGTAFEAPMLLLRGGLQWTPWPVAVWAVGLLACHLGGLRLAVVCVGSLLYIAVSGYWPQAMNTLALVGIAVPLSLLIGLLVGIWADKTNSGNRVVPPLLDLMQTMPTFAYLIPLLVLFGFGPVVGLIASAIYACPPMVRNVRLGLSRISPEIIDASVMAGSSARQQLWWVELPTALAQIKVGINQTIMAALSMVIIASVIGGFDDIGWEVLSTMRKARFGDSVLAGAVIVLLAIVIDRISLAYAGSGAQRSPFAGCSTAVKRLLLLSPVALCLGLKLAQTDLPIDSPGWTRALAGYLDSRLEGFVISRGELLTTLKNQFFYYYLLPLKIGLDRTILPFTWGVVFSDNGRLGFWVVSLGLGLLLVLKGFRRAGFACVVLCYLIYFGFSGIAWPLWLAAVVLLAWQVAGRRVALFALAALGFIVLTGMWERAMVSLYLCAAAAILSFALGATLGVWAAVSNTVSAVLRPIADTFQTLPQFVFLIPALMFFQVGEFTALLAIIAYAFVPAMRYVEAGLRQVPADLIEVAVEQGCTGRQIFWQVKLPLAMPSIMVGINQTIMYAFAMLVIAALVGTTGLGQQIFLALSSADTGLGLVAGLSMALLAMVADRILQALAADQQRYSA